ncbi:hypothetical protein OAK52_01220 [Chloroflexi bacterium]|jgi:hypothetical protein|nr:hypothetical protein [Chloroflexota bacterium]|tara:strand:- start:111 stop:233 length:123 start_codon:yes stop_codon:yes gene_type:complete
MNEKRKKEDSSTEIKITRKEKLNFLNDLFESDDKTNVYLG